MIFVVDYARILLVVYTVFRLKSHELGRILTLLLLPVGTTYLSLCSRLNV